MKSPFPGMDPYLERHWGDMHTSLVTYARDQLQAQLPADLRARVQERVVLESPFAPSRAAYPDVRMVEHPGPTPSGGAAIAEITVAEPLVFVLEMEPMTDRFIEIVDARSGNRVVTVIDFLSPANKLPGDGRRDYRRKQREVLRSDASLEEIDLTRAGRRRLAIPDALIPPQYQTTYAACVRRGWQRARVEYYPISLRQRLPAIRIPLRREDGDVALDLQALAELCYRNGRYDDLDYTRPLEPPLAPDDAAWAAELLRQRGATQDQP